MSETFEPLDFYFDFSSPYGYLASERIDALAAQHGRKVRWHPILLGVVFKVTGSVPLTKAPFKAAYYLRDFARSARFMGIPYRQPDHFPLPTQQAARAYYWLHSQDCALARQFAHRIYRALFVENLDISASEVVLDQAAALGVERAALQEAVALPQWKDRLREEIEQAMQRGVFGSPTMIVDGELFFGADRLPQLERWLESGGFQAAPEQR